MPSPVRNVAFTVRPGERHLGGFAAAEEVLDVLIEVWDGVRPTVSVPA
jgi:hypothetical protein